MIDERLKRYEALLRDNGIDPSPVVDPSEPESRHQISSIEMPETTWTLPPQATIFKPQLVQGQRGIELVDKLEEHYCYTLAATR
ncbi:hypothetical protein PVAG01_11242 [Phlyctema vagabunda]|uniref:Uncharacterized protein n=1 Tax=Phlyctema vagabunda TaxID=108571 RepID=A0ABR4P1R3_9HELO